MEPSEKTEALIAELKAKFEASGQNINDYLEGMLIGNYEPYWRYIAVDALLSLQQPKTDVPDEMIFIGYHQITELYFKLILHELEQMRDVNLGAKRFADKLSRIRRYFNNLIYSFDIMIDGMEKEQFLKFRMALLPSSGFQSAQFRLIEMAFTDLNNLALAEQREALIGQNLEMQYNAIYWKQGAVVAETGRKPSHSRNLRMPTKNSFCNGPPNGKIVTSGKWLKSLFRWDNLPTNSVKNSGC